LGLIARCAPVLLVPIAQADHTDDACPDTHTNGGQDLTFDVSVQATGQPVFDGMVLPQFTQIRVHAIATALGRCDTYHAFGQQCVAGSQYERTVFDIRLYETTDFWPAEWRSGSASADGQFHHVIDTYDTTSSDASTGPMGTSLGVVGPYLWEVRNRINTAICHINPDRVSKFMRVYVRNNSGDENLGCRKDAVAGNPCNVTTGNKYQMEVDCGGTALPVVRH
jgi:hypothetical protein